MTLLERTYRTIDFVRVKSNEAIVFCSLGKDSLVLLDLLYPRLCVFMYFVPGLEHIERWVNWVKARYPKVEFIQIPHWNLTYILRSGMYCVPNPKIKLLKLADVDNAMRLKFGIDYVFYGMKKADSMNRRLMLNTYPDYENAGKVYPLADWTQKEVLTYMRQKGLPEPIRYSSKASGGIGFNLDCFLWLRENFPGDLKKIIKAFPMSERILFEYDNGIKQIHKE